MGASRWPPGASAPCDPQVTDLRICVWPRPPSTVLDVSPTGRNGHHRGERKFARSRPVPGQTPPNSTWETRTFRSTPRVVRSGSRGCYSGRPTESNRSAGAPPRPSRAMRKQVERLLQWDTSRRAKRARSTASSRKRKDLTPKSDASNLEGLPRRQTEKSVNGARPNLENSTACQKSMPITSSRGGSEPGLRLGDAVTSNENPLVDNEFLAIASCSCSVSETTLLG